MNTFNQTDASEVTIAGLPEVAEDLTTWAWTEEYFDGPLSGVVIYDDRPCWFVFHHLSDVDDRFSYVIFRLADCEFVQLSVQHFQGRKASPPRVVRDRPVAWFTEQSGSWRRGRDPRARARG